MDLEFIKITETEIDAAFGVFKEYMKPLIDGAFAWDEQFQRNGFASRLRPGWFYWVYSKGSRVGLVCYKHTNQSVHVHLLVVFANCQGKGIGQAVIKYLMFQAYELGRSLSLSCFKKNDPALNLYKKLGFLIVSEDEHTYGFISDVTGT